MSFKCEQIRIPMSMWTEKYSDAYVWYRDSGNRVIVVIDDEWHWCRRPWSKVPTRKIIYPLLKEGACALSDIQAIGFFPLAADRSDAHKVLEAIKKWLDGIKKQEFRVYFLVDVVSDHSRVINSHRNEFNPEIAYRSTIEWLEKNGYPLECIRNLTYAGGDEQVLNPTRDFQKMPEALYIREHCKKFSPRFMEFLGIGLHKDEIIDNAIQFYAKAWEEDRLGCTHFNATGWCHDCLQEKDSNQLKELANWLDVSPDHFCERDMQESAKALMIWKERDLWEDPPWKVRDRRRIKGKVLNAVLKKLEIRSTDSVPDDDPIVMPCVPCFPFLVSLRGLLWRCEQDKVQIEGVCFFKLGEDKPQANIFRFMLEDREVSEALARRFFGQLVPEHLVDPKDLRDPGAVTQSLKYLICCKTLESPKDNNANQEQKYINLFYGTELPVVAVEIGAGQINIIWSVR